jgi:hypothetical protein
MYYVLVDIPLLTGSTLSLALPQAIRLPHLNEKGRETFLKLSRNCWAFFKELSFQKV